MEKDLSACPSFLKLLMDDDYKNEIVSNDEESDSSSSSDEKFNEEDGEGDEDIEDNDHVPSKGQSAKNANYRKIRVRSGRCDNETQKSKHDKRNSGVRGKEEKEKGLGREETVYAKDGHFEINLKNPYFVRKLKKSHKSHMSIPHKFAKQTKLDFKETLFLHGEDDRQWPVKIRTNDHEVFVGKGWFEFWEGYQIKVGDTCKFTLLRSLRNVFSVEIMRT